MAEAAFHKGEARFPVRGTTWQPLPRGKQGKRVQAHAVQTIDRTPEEIFNTYARIELLPAWQEGVVSVVRTGAKSLRWVMQDPGTGKQFEFDSEDLERVPGKRHVSRITSGPLSGTTETLTLSPHPAGRGTVATLVSDYVVPGGWFTNAVSAVVSRRPEQVTIENLRHLKQMLEGGEIPRVDGQPAGPRSAKAKAQRFLMGENLPTPPGTSDRALPQDLPQEQSGGRLGWGMVLAIGAVALPVVAGLLLANSIPRNDDSIPS